MAASKLLLIKGTRKVHYSKDYDNLLARVRLTLCGRSVYGEPVSSDLYEVSCKTCIKRDNKLAFGGR